MASRRGSSVLAHRVSALVACLVLIAGEVSANPKSSPVDKKSTPAADEAKAEIKNSIGMPLVLIRSGNFLMGAPDSDLNVPPYERPQHRVRIRKSFYFGKYEVTRGQFRKFIEATGYSTECERNGQGGMGYRKVNNGARFSFGGQFSWRNTGFEQTDEHPVVNVTWNDTEVFCVWLSKEDGKRYRLPTEAEWEWSCRAGTIDRFYLGDDPGVLEGKINLADASLGALGVPINVVKWNDGFPFTAPVGKFKPNLFGLYDMHGNVREWCSDWFDENEKYYAKSPINDPRGPAIGSYGVSRGGSWQYRPPACRSASRIWHSRSYPNIDLGFRVVCELAAPDPKATRIPAEPDAWLQRVTSKTANGNVLIFTISEDGAVTSMKESGILFWKSILKLPEGVKPSGLRVANGVLHMNDTSGVTHQFHAETGTYLGKL